MTICWVLWIVLENYQSWGFATLDIVQTLFFWRWFQWKLLEYPSNLMLYVHVPGDFPNEQEYSLCTFSNTKKLEILSHIFLNIKRIFLEQF